MLKSLVMAATAALFCVPIHTTHAQAVEYTHVRILHAAPAVSEISAQIGDERTAINALGYSAITPWHRLEAGAYPFTIVDATGAILTAAEIHMEPGNWLTLVLTGNPERESLSLRALPTSLDEIAPGEGRLSVFHAIEGAPPVDLVSDDAALIQYITYPNGQDGFVTVDIIATTYNFRATRNLDQAQTIIDLGEVNLQARQNTFLVLIGTPDNPTYSIFIEDIQAMKRAEHPPLRIDIPDDARQGFVRLGHFASGAPNVDLIINGELSAVSDLPFATISTFVELPAGTHTVIIATGEVQLVTEFTLQVASGTWQTIGLIGAVGNSTLSAQVFEEDMSTIPDNQTRIGVFQAIPGLPPLNVQTADGTTLIRLLGYPGSQGGNDGYEAVEIIAGATDLDLTEATADGEIIIDLPGTTFEANHTYLIAPIRAEPPYLIEGRSLEMLETENTGE